MVIRIWDPGAPDSCAASCPPLPHSRVTRVTGRKGSVIKPETEHQITLLQAGLRLRPLHGTLWKAGLTDVTDVQIQFSVEGWHLPSPKPKFKYETSVLIGCMKEGIQRTWRPNQWCVHTCGERTLEHSTRPRLSDPLLALESVTRKRWQRWHACHRHD